MPIYFITGNKNKFEEAKAIIPDLEMLTLDLKEIQEIDPEKIIQEKLAEAAKHHDGEFLVEDQSLHLDALNGLPGPFIKWFLQTMGVEGIYKMVQKLGNNKAQNEINIGYYDGNKQEHFFKSVIDGEIVEPKGDKDFGWGPLFKPTGADKTYGEMDKGEKALYSSRIFALKKLKDFLDKNNK